MNQKTPFDTLLEKAKTNKKGLIALKTAAVTLQDFEMAAQLRALEKTFFPETPEQKEAKKEADVFSGCLRMAELSVEPRTAWAILQVAKCYIRKKNKFNLATASKIITQQQQIFE
jgi:hypothetical protein